MIGLIKAISLANLDHVSKESILAVLAVYNFEWHDITHFKVLLVKEKHIRSKTKETKIVGSDIATRGHYVFP